MVPEKTIKDKMSRESSTAVGANRKSHKGKVETLESMHDEINTENDEEQNNDNKKNLMPDMKNILGYLN